MPATPIRIDVWSDVACPWCYIGKRKLEAGIDAYAATPGAVPVEVEYHSFELSPETPVDYDGTTVEFLVQRKGFTADQVTAMLARVTDIARGVGLDYDFDAVQHTKTLKAHELLHHAKARGVQDAMKERLLRAYFVEGRHVGRDEDLADLAAEVGLDRDEVLEVLREGVYADAVAADIRQAGAYGIGGVPFFVIDGRLGVSGAQDATVFTQALQQVAAERGEVA